MRKISFYLISLMLLLSTALSAEQPVSISIDKQKLVLGDSAIFTVKSKTSGIPAPTIESTEDLQIDYIGSQRKSTSSFHIVINGREFKSKESQGEIRYEYKILPKREGILQFPSIDIDIGDRIIRTKPFPLEVTSQDQSTDDIFLNVSLNKDEVYLGEEVVLTFQWFFNKDIEGYECNIPWMTSLQNFVLKDPPMNKQKRYQRFIINNSQEVLAEKSTRRFKGKQYAVIQFQKILVPISTGEFDFDSTFLKCEVVEGYEQGRASRSFFDDFFGSDFDRFFGVGRRAVTKPLVLKTEPIHLKVLDVPETGQPESYQNAVGEFELNVSFSPLEVSVGEPITMTMELVGKGNVAQAEMPVFDVPESFRGYDPEEKVEEIINSRGAKLVSKKIEKVLIPTQEGEYEVDPTSFSFFNTKTKQFETLEKGAVTLKVDPSPSYIANQESLYQSRSVELQDQDEIKLIKHDIQYIKHSLGKIEPLFRSFLVNYLFLFAYLIVTIVLSLVLYLLSREKRKLRTDKKYAQKFFAFSQAKGNLVALKKQLDTGSKDFYFEAVRCLTQYLVSKLSLSAGTDLANIIHHLDTMKVSQETKIKLKEFYESSEAIRYSGGVTSIQDTETRKSFYRSVKSLIERLEKEL